MKKILVIVVIALVAGCSGSISNRPPQHLMIECAYFKCEKCKSLEGGIYGKGPFKSLHSSGAVKCWHDWQRIDRKEFKILGTAWCGIDWCKEIPFWSRVSPAITPEATDH